MRNYKQISFFEGLNALRFFAAFFVVMHHAETIKKKNGLFDFEWLGLFRNGGNAVIFFFVLSGFLITYLLLQENSKTGIISISNFYLKRMLRIWPLYFLLVAIGAIILPVLISALNINYDMPYYFGQVWYYFLFFVPGLVTFYFGHHLLEPLWSIGVEEVFYLIWAPLFRVFKDKNILVLLFSVIVIMILLLLLDLFWIKIPVFSYLVNTFSFEAMAVGGLGAYFVFNRSSPISELFIFSKLFQLFIFTVLAVFLLFHTNINNAIWNIVFKTPIISEFFIDFLFLYLIIGVSLAKNCILKFNNKTLSYLGEISYGIYMYHMLVIFGLMLFLKKYFATMHPIVFTIFFYLMVTIIVITVSAISKKIFENKFLQLKSKLIQKH